MECWAGTPGDEIGRDKRKTHLGGFGWASLGLLLNLRQPKEIAEQGNPGKMWSGQQEFLSAVGIGKQIPNPQKHREKILIPGSLGANRSDPSCSHGIIPNTALGAGKSQDVASKGPA